MFCLMRKLFFVLSLCIGLFCAGMAHASDEDEFLLSELSMENDSDSVEELDEKYQSLRKELEKEYQNEK